MAEREDEARDKGTGVELWAVVPETLDVLRNTDSPFVDGEFLAAGSIKCYGFEDELSRLSPP